MPGRGEQGLQTGLVVRRTKPLEDRPCCLDLQRCGVVVPKRTAGQGHAQPGTRVFIQRVELSPDGAGMMHGIERAAWVAFCEQDGSRGCGRHRMQDRRVKLRGDAGQLVLDTDVLPAATTAAIRERDVVG